LPTEQHASHTACLSAFARATAPTYIYPLSLHDALPISSRPSATSRPSPSPRAKTRGPVSSSPPPSATPPGSQTAPPPAAGTATGTRSSPTDTTATTPRSEEHTSELQSRENLVCRLLLAKKDRT